MFKQVHANLPFSSWPVKPLFHPLHGRVCFLFQGQLLFSVSRCSRVGQRSVHCLQYKMPCCDHTSKNRQREKVRIDNKCFGSWKEML